MVFNFIVLQMNLLKLNDSNALQSVLNSLDVTKRS